MTRSLRKCAHPPGATMCRGRRSEVKVITISEPGGPEVLCLHDREAPVPGHGEVRIRVAFAGVNRPDALQRAGAYDPPPGASDSLALQGPD